MPGDGGDAALQMNCVVAKLVDASPTADTGVVGVPVSAATTAARARRQTRNAYA
jgi:hypothetical protein